MPLWHTDYFEIQLHKKWMMKQENIKDMQKLFGKQIHQTVFIKIFDNFTSYAQPCRWSNYRKWLV